MLGARRKSASSSNSRARPSLITGTSSTAMPRASASDRRAASNRRSNSPGWEAVAIADSILARRTPASAMRAKVASQASKSRRSAGRPPGECHGRWISMPSTGSPDPETTSRRPVTEEGIPRRRTDGSQVTTIPWPVATMARSYRTATSAKTQGLGHRRPSNRTMARSESMKPAPRDRIGSTPSTRSISRPSAPRRMADRVNDR